MHYFSFKSAIGIIKFHFSTLKIVTQARGALPLCATRHRAPKQSPNYAPCPYTAPNFNPIDTGNQPATTQKLAWPRLPTYTGPLPLLLSFTSPRRAQFHALAPRSCKKAAQLQRPTHTHTHTHTGEIEIGLAGPAGCLGKRGKQVREKATQRERTRCLYI